MRDDFNIANFRYEEVSVFGIGTIFNSITKIDTSEDFIIEDDLYYDILDNYKKYMRYFIITQNLILNFVP